MMKFFAIFLSLLLTAVACTKNDVAAQTIQSDAMYFPSKDNSIWETTSISSLGWNQKAVQSLKEFLTQKNTKSFIILVDGKIAIEEYFDGHSANSTWPWNSAGKTLIATTTGIAQQEGLLKIDNKVSDYLGSSWTNMPLEKENLISVKHLLTMTAGNNERKQLIMKSNLTYVADAGTRWAYSNIFQKLTHIVAIASHQNFETYFNDRLKSKIGMDGFWKFGPLFTIYHSTSRSMARFGLLALHQGKWDDEQILDNNFFHESISPSQTLNPSYGYFWWLNGKSSFMIPRRQNIYKGCLVPNAPADMYSAMGANDQRIYVVPSKKMVVVRMGNAADSSSDGNFAVSGFDNELWERINAVIK